MKNAFWGNAKILQSSAGFFLLSLLLVVFLNLKIILIFYYKLKSPDQKYKFCPIQAALNSSRIRLFD